VDNKDDSLRLTTQDGQGIEKNGTIRFDTTDDKDECCKNITSKIYCFELLRKGDFENMDDKVGKSTTSLVLKSSEPSGTFKNIGICRDLLSLAYESAPETVAIII
jgi:hypothetical protein